MLDATDERFADVGGRRLRYWMAGAGSGPSIVLEAGLGTAAVDWAALVPALAERGTVIAYDRAGLGGSDVDHEARTAGRLADDLEALLRAAGVRPPLLLVAHSWGGAVARTFARRHPGDLAGLVLVDPTHEATLSRPMLVLNHVTYATLYALARVGLLPAILRRSPPVTLYGDEQRATALAQMAGMGTVRAAWHEFRGTGRSARELAASPLDAPLAVPVVVLSGGGTSKRRVIARMYERVHRLHAALVAEGTGGYHAVEGSSHFVHIEAPETVLAAVDHVLAG